MGYTHYFDQQQECPPEAWAEITASMGKLVSTALLLGNPLPIRAAFNNPAPFYADKDILYFNGWPESCESFQLTQANHGFEFCKTRQRPYDIAVTALLCLVHYHAPGVWKIESDGTVMDWTAGLTLARQVQPECSLPFD